MKKFCICKLCVMVFGALLAVQGAAAEETRQPESHQFGISYAKKWADGTFHDASSGRDLPMDNYKHTFHRFHGYLDLGFIKNASALIEIEGERWTGTFNNRASRSADKDSLVSASLVLGRLNVYDASGVEVGLGISISDEDDKLVQVLYKTGLPYGTWLSASYRHFIETDRKLYNSSDGWYWSDEGFEADLKLGKCFLSSICVALEYQDEARERTNNDHYQYSGPGLEIGYYF